MPAQSRFRIQRHFTTLLNSLRHGLSGANREFTPSRRQNLYALVPPRATLFFTLRRFYKIYFQMSPFSLWFAQPCPLSVAPTDRHPTLAPHRRPIVLLGIALLPAAIRALVALFRFRSIRALGRPISLSLNTGSIYGYVLGPGPLRAYASAPHPRPRPHGAGHRSPAAFAHRVPIPSNGGLCQRVQLYSLYIIIW